MKIKSNTTNNHITSLPWQEPEEELVLFSSDEGLQWRPKRQGKSLLVVFDLIFIIHVWTVCSYYLLMHSGLTLFILLVHNQYLSDAHLIAWNRCAGFWWPSCYIWYCKEVTGTEYLDVRCWLSSFQSALDAWPLMLTSFKSFNRNCLVWLYLHECHLEVLIKHLTLSVS